MVAMVRTPKCWMHVSSAYLAVPKVSPGHRAAHVVELDAVAVADDLAEAVESYR
jgi:hypothetical protein